MSKRLKIETVAKRVHHQVQKALAKGYYLKACWGSGGEDGRRCLLTAIVESETRGTHATITKSEATFGYSASQRDYVLKAAPILGLTYREAKALEYGFERALDGGLGERELALYAIGQEVNYVYGA